MDTYRADRLTDAWAPSTAPVVAARPSVGALTWIKIRNLSPSRRPPTMPAVTRLLSRRWRRSIALMLIGAVLSAAQASLIVHAGASPMPIAQASTATPGSNSENPGNAAGVRAAHCAGYASERTVDKGFCNFHCQSVHQVDSHAEVPTAPFAPQPAVLVACSSASEPLSRSSPWLHARGTAVPARILLVRLLI